MSAQQTFVFPSKINNNITVQDTPNNVLIGMSAQDHSGNRNITNFVEQEVYCEIVAPMALGVIGQRKGLQGGVRGSD